MSILFDRERVRMHAQRAHLLNGDLFLIARMADALRDRLFDIKRSFDTVVEIAPQAMVVNEQARIDKTIRHAFHFSALEGSGTAIIDDEILPIAAQSCDALISLGSLHWVNDLPGTLVQMKRALKPDGVFLAGFFGGETLQELRDVLTQTESQILGGVSPRVSPFIGLPDMAALMQRAQFTLPVVDYERVTVTYKDLKSLIRDLRAMGQTHAVLRNDKRILPKRFWQRAEERYRADFATEDGRLKATFDLFYLIGWAPHESQQKPLKPGSATHRLADILKSEEKGTGEFV